MHPLLQMHVGRSADLRHPGLDLLGQGKVFGVGSGDLDIDGRGQAEVQNLAHDIRSRKGELHVRKIVLEPLPEHAHIVRRGTVMLRVERHEDFTVGGTDGGIVAEGEIDAAGGQADVREDGAHLVRRHHLANDLGDCIEARLGHLEPGAFRRPAMQAELARIHRGKEIPPEKRDEAERNQHQRAHGKKDNSAMIERPIQGRNIGLAQFFKTVIEAVVDAAEPCEDAARSGTVAGDFPDSLPVCGHRASRSHRDDA